MDMKMRDMDEIQDDPYDLSDTQSGSYHRELDLNAPTTSTGGDCRRRRESQREENDSFQSLTGSCHIGQGPYDASSCSDPSNILGAADLTTREASAAHEQPRVPPPPQHDPQQRVVQHPPVTSPASPLRHSFSSSMLMGYMASTRGSSNTRSEAANSNSSRSFHRATNTLQDAKDSDDSPHGNPEEQHFSEAPEDGSPGSFRSRSLEATAALSSSIAQSMLFQSSQGSFGATNAPQARSPDSNGYSFDAYSSESDSQRVSPNIFKDNGGGGGSVARPAVGRVRLRSLLLPAQQPDPYIM